jgi:hypothetical protein
VTPHRQRIVVCALLAVSGLVLIAAEAFLAYLAFSR